LEPIATSSEDAAKMNAVAAPLVGRSLATRILPRQNVKTCSMGALGETIGGWRRAMMEEGLSQLISMVHRDASVGNWSRAGGAGSPRAGLCRAGFVHGGFVLRLCPHDVSRSSGVGVRGACIDGLRR